MSLLALAGSFNVHLSDKEWNKEDNPGKRVGTLFCLLYERNKDESDKCQRQDTRSKIEPRGGIEVWHLFYKGERIEIVQPGEKALE